jgi:hypothetical protein
MSFTGCALMRGEAGGGGGKVYGGPGVGGGMLKTFVSIVAFVLHAVHTPGCVMYSLSWVCRVRHCDITSTVLLPKRRRRR